MSSKYLPMVGILHCSTLNNAFNSALLEKVDSLLRELYPDLPVKTIRIDGNENFEEEGALRLLDGVDVLIANQFMFNSVRLLGILKDVKWLHVFTAGVENIVQSFHKQGNKIPVLKLTRNAGHFDNEIVEYVFGVILMRERLILKFYESQKLSKWEPFTVMRPLKEITLGIVGFGSIGQKVAKMAFNFGMKVIALIHKNKEVFKDFVAKNSELRLTEDIRFLLSSSDYVCNLLPSTPSTEGFFDNDILEHCKNKKSVFINVGRANVIKEQSIIKALDKDWIQHAILDVFEVEPLPETNPLWKRSDITITPHHAAIHFDYELFINEFKENYDKFCLGQTLNNLVDWNKGY